MARAGIASRRKCEEFIRDGQVSVNDQIVTTLGTKIDPTIDHVELEGKTINIGSVKSFLFYKPKYVITSMYDPQGRPTVVDYFKQIPQRVYPVGRLDFDTEGLLILTNDGDLANKLMHPRYKIDKKYLVKVNGEITEKQIDQLQNGIDLSDGKTSPAKADLIYANEKISKFELVIREGRNRQIRRMCDTLGYPTKSLVRIEIAFLKIDRLRPGDFRELTKFELDRLAEFWQ